jgi:hypothetical protein
MSATDQQIALGQCWNTGPTYALQAAQPFSTAQPSRQILMNHTSHPNGAVKRAAIDHGYSPPWGGRPRGSLSRMLTVLGLAGAIILAALSAGCAPAIGKGSTCAPQLEALPTSRASSLIAIIPRTSADAASWGLRELAFLLPFVARAGLELHVFYTQDSDDLVEGGGDGGPPQVLETQAPTFPVVQIQGEPQPPADPNALTAKLYCARLAAWQSNAGQTLMNRAASRDSAVNAWARSSAARLIALAARPIPDTTGREAGVEFDAAASIFAAAEVAQAAPQPTIVVMGGLTDLAPPSEKFEIFGRFVVLVRSTNPAQVLPAERAWSRWVAQAGATFQAMSSNDSPTVIAAELLS